MNIFDVRTRTPLEAWPMVMAKDGSGHVWAFPFCHGNCRGWSPELRMFVLAVWPDVFVSIGSPANRRFAKGQPF
jgi:hypothetical protein